MIFQRDQLSTVVCNIRTPKTGGKEEVGTAIFISNNTDAYLLTAAHVISNITAHSYAVISNLDGSPQRVDLSTLIGGATFVIHRQADLAKAKINISSVNAPYIQNRCFPYSQIDMSENFVSKDIELTTIGFPQGLGASGAKFTPLTFRTFVAAPAITLSRFDNQIPCDFIILELPATGGYSGGPLMDLGYIISGNMTMTKAHTILYGIVHGTISDSTGGKLAAITPCKYLAGWL